jgi:hypothetical protein
MRDFYFRAWHEANKEMVYFDNSKAKKDQYIAGSMMSIFDGDFSTPMMQFTGVWDSEGFRLYEGDYFRQKGYKDFYEIQFKEGMFCYKILGSFAPLKNITEFINEIERCGNIYEGIK